MTKLNFSQKPPLAKPTTAQSKAALNPKSWYQNNYVIWGAVILAIEIVIIILYKK